MSPPNNYDQRTTFSVTDTKRHGYLNFAILEVEHHSHPNTSSNMHHDRMDKKIILKYKVTLFPPKKSKQSPLSLYVDLLSIFQMQILNKWYQAGYQENAYYRQGSRIFKQIGKKVKMKTKDSLFTFSNPSCDAFTFQTSTSQCRHFISIGRLQTNQITSTSGVDLYEKERCDVVPTGTLF